MKKILFLFCFSVVIGFSCTETPSAHNDPNHPGGDNTKDSIDQVTGNGDNLPTERPTCEIAGLVLEGNEFWAKSENEVVVIVADETTKDEEMGDSHRILEIYDGKTCEKILRKELPQNISPDFPYYLSDITYNNVSKVVAIRGFDKIYILDLQNNQLSEPLTPQYLNERYAEDAQSGLIRHMEVWENYLIGYATDNGTFVFDLDEPMSAKAVLPIAEYPIIKGREYNSLFVLDAGNVNSSANQAIIPKFDPNNGNFRINPLFEAPLKVQTNINSNFRDNRFLVLKELKGGNESRPIGIDMKTVRLFDIPDDIARKKDTDIISWMKSQPE